MILMFDFQPKITNTILDFLHHLTILYFISNDHGNHHFNIMRNLLQLHLHLQHHQNLQSQSLGPTTQLLIRINQLEHLGEEGDVMVTDQNVYKLRYQKRFP